MSWVLPKVLGPIDDIPLASKVVNSVGNTLCIDTLLCALSEVLILLETVGSLDTVLEHFPTLLAQFGIFIMIWLKILFPRILDKGSHFIINYNLN